MPVRDRGVSEMGSLSQSAYGSKSQIGGGIGKGSFTHMYPLQEVDRARCLLRCLRSSDLDHLDSRFVSVGFKMSFEMS